MPQSIDHLAGWNIVSINVVPADTVLIDILQPLIDSNNLVKVIDEGGNFIQNLPGFGWYNTIGNMANTEGYYLKVIQHDTLNVIGD